MGNLLFSSKGRIASSTFLKAGIVLSILSGLLFAVLVVQQSIGKIGLALFLLSFYPWFCLWSKRLRNGGKSPWLILAYLLLLAVLFIAFYITTLIFFSGGDFSEVIMSAARQEISTEVYMERLNAISAGLDPRVVLRNIALSFLGASVITLLVGDRATPNLDTDFQSRTT